MFTVSNRIQSARDCAARWRRQYFQNGKWGTTISGSAKATYEQLLACDGDADKIDAILPGWVNEFCHECHEYNDPSVTFDNCGDSACVVCLKCLRKALRAIRRGAQ